MALEKKYIQLNPPAMQSFLIFDIDYAGAVLAAGDAGLPVPTLTVINPQNKHAHVIYVLSKPVCTSIYASEKPIRYLEAIKNAYVQRLGADMSYRGLIAKNPWHPYWDTIEDGNAVYDLAKLAKYVELSSEPVKIAQSGLGRNCTLFDSLRLWSYKAIRDYWRPGGAEDWFTALADQAEVLRGLCLNVDGYPLAPREVHAIVRSVWRWTWREITPDDLADLVQRTHAPEQQQARANKRWAKESKKEQGLELMRQGLNNEEIGRRLEVSLSTVKRWKIYFNTLAL
jgi:hypothetical protein